MGSSSASSSRPARVSPVVVLAMVSALPAVALAGLWRVATSRADDAQLATAAAAEPAPLDQLPATPVFSLRRAPQTVANDVNVDGLAAAVGATVPMLPEGSCLAVAVDGATVTEHQAAAALVPASNVKLATAAVALERLGSDYRFTTQARGEVAAGGVVQGDLHLVGGGDPLLAAPWYPRSDLTVYPQEPATPLEQLVEGIAAAGVTEILGSVRGDGSRYDDEFFVPTWSQAVRGVEAGPIDALMVNDGIVQGERRKPQDPAEAAAREFTRLLEERGIDVRGRPGVGIVPGETAVVAEVHSAPLGEIVGEMLTNSDNNTAEMLVKELGVAGSGSGTRDAGLAVISATLAQWGVPAEASALVDGSGLSTDNRMSCTALLAILTRQPPQGDVARGLAVLGRTGTLADVGGDHPLAGRLVAKTGTLSTAKALSGYVPVEGSSAVTFALVLNGAGVSDQAIYRPIWSSLFDALASYPSSPAVDQLRPLASPAAAPATAATG